MKSHPAPGIVNVDRFDGGVIVTFDDGRCALYAASLLLATLPQAIEVHDSEPDEEAKTYLPNPT